MRRFIGDADRPAGRSAPQGHREREQRGAPTPAGAPRRCRRFAEVVALAVVTLLWPSPPSVANATAPPPAAAAEPDPIPIFYADFGWSGQVVPERWGPITVWVAGGEEPFAGTLVLEFRQDATQSASIAVPFATTPGKLTPVRFVAALPSYTSEVRVLLRDERGRTRRTLTYATNAAGEATALMPSPLAPGSALIVGVGRTSVTDAARGWEIDRSLERMQDRLTRLRQNSGLAVSTGLQRPPNDEELREAWDRVGAARIEAGVMPLAEAAYDGVLVLAVEAEAALAAEPRARAAVLDWVRSGGRLVIVASGPGAAWREWLPSDEEGELVEVGPVTRGPLPLELAEALTKRAAADAQRERDRLLDADAAAAADARRPPPIAEPAERIAKRPLRLTDRALAEGWSLRWSAPDGAALAEGPLGFGWVTVIGLDPQLAASVVSERATAVVWQSALENAAGDWIEAAVHEDRGAGAPAGMFPGMAELPSTRSLTAVAQTLSRIPAPGDGVFFGIAGAVALLALLVGPFDAAVLKRLGIAQRSWLTALLWIGLATGGAYVMPELIRSGPTRVARFTVLDRIVRPGDPPLARGYQSGVTGLYFAESGRVEFTTMDPGSWWRGFSAQQYYAGELRLPAPVPTFQSPDGQGRGNPLEAFGAGMWTFRTFTDQSSPTTAVTGRIRRDPGGGGWRLTVVGLPEGVAVEGGAVQVAEGWHDLGVWTDEPVREGAWTVRLDDRDATDLPPAMWSATMGEPVYDARGRFVEFTPLPPCPAVAEDLPGADRRSAAFARRAATGRWAAVYLQLSNVPPDAGVAWEAEYERRGLVRLLLPVEGADRQRGTDEGNVP